MGGSDFDEALKIALRVERASQTQNLCVQVAATDHQPSDKPAQESAETRLILQRLNDLEQKLETMNLKLESATKSEVRSRPATKSPRHNSPEARFDDRYHRYHRSQSPTRRSYHSMDSTYRHRSPSPHSRDYTARSPDRSVHYHRSSSPNYSRHRSSSPSYSRYRSSSPRQNIQGHVLQPRPPHYQSYAGTSPSRKPQTFSGNHEVVQQGQQLDPSTADYHAPRSHAPYRQVRFEDHQSENFW